MRSYELVTVKRQKLEDSRSAVQAAEANGKTVLQAFILAVAFDQNDVRYRVEGIKEPGLVLFLIALNMVFRSVKEPFVLVKHTRYSISFRAFLLIADDFKEGKSQLFLQDFSVYSN